MEQLKYIHDWPVIPRGIPEPARDSYFAYQPLELPRTFSAEDVGVGLAVGAILGVVATSALAYVLMPRLCAGATLTEAIKGLVPTIREKLTF